jgi:hypothetical protein
LSRSLIIKLLLKVTIASPSNKTVSFGLFCVLAQQKSTDPFESSQKGISAFKVIFDRYINNCLKMNKHQTLNA